jgi:hypothetical protein
MAFFLRTIPAPDTTGGCRAFRPYVRSDFRRRCAYCLIDELLAGGEENFEMDHFRAKSRFPDLENDFYNMYYACHPCNHIKRDYWPPADLQARGITIVDLCNDDFATHFRIVADGTWDGLSESAKYTIEILRLNRQHLVKIREMLQKLGVDLRNDALESDLSQLFSKA